MSDEKRDAALAKADELMSLMRPLGTLLNWRSFRENLADALQLERYESELECIRELCTLCKQEMVPQTRWVGANEVMDYWHEPDGAVVGCRAAAIYELRRREYERQHHEAEANSVPAKKRD